MNPPRFDVSTPEAAGSAQGHLAAKRNGRRLIALFYGALLAVLIAVLMVLGVMSARVT
jgi:uncharacterized integral membrane protein